LDNAEREPSRYEAALKIAMKAHSGQLDKGGHPYIEHPITVAGMVEGDAKIVALLHDVIEDGGIKLHELSCFSPDIVSAVDAISQRTNETRRAYLGRVKNNELARIVKIADLTHNSDLSRIQNPTKRDRDRVIEYREELTFLKTLQ